MRGKKIRKSAGWWILAVLCIVIVGFVCGETRWKPSGSISCPEKGSDLRPTAATTENEKKEASVNKEIYEKIYIHMKSHQSQLRTNGIAEGYFDADSDIAEEGLTGDYQTENPGSVFDYFGTNVQVEYIDEGDIIKNDGRYLYQIVPSEDDRHSYIQIVDTQNGLREAAKIGHFTNIQEIYVWKDCLVVTESLWAHDTSNDIDEMYSEVPFSKVTFYDLKERTKPEKISSFAVKGNYKTSRIAEGYFYFFSAYGIADTVEKENLSSYLPTVSGQVLEADALYLPENITATSYLLMVSVDLSDPSEFDDKMAVVSRGDLYYVGADNIYVLERMELDYDSDGIKCDKTKIIRFSYKNGQIEAGAEGIVEGKVLDQFAMDEYNDCLRIVTTVSRVHVETVADDFSGQTLGYYDYEYLPESNSVYVLDTDLKVIGSITGLAEEERVYSARFMGDTGYFVTYKQVDPLFSVDFSDPKNPQVLGELKISGFSEYLHFYGENQLVGIGYETDEDTGVVKGMKLSMFDISNPVDVKEAGRLVLSEYDYSDALDNHHAVLINGKKNLIGFMAEGYRDEWIREYGIYSYDEEIGFTKQFVIDCISDEYKYYETRGTYIKDIFYLLEQNGGVRAYDLNSGRCIDQLEM